MRHPLSFKLSLSGLLVILVVSGGVLGARHVAAGRALSPKAAARTSPLHPTFPLLDANGANVLSSGQPVSTIKTCGECHDTAFIEQHSFHADLGLRDASRTTAGQTGSGRAWDTSNGLFGKWDPLTYRYLSPAGDERLDLSTAEWLMTRGERVAGGGPATTSRQGQPLTTLAPRSNDPETSRLGPDGQPATWDWNKSGVVEMNCFLCHWSKPNNAARVESLEAGQFKWANTATLAGTGIVTKTAEGWKWNPQAFDAEGRLARDWINLQDPTDANCAQCHGLVHSDPQEPLTLAGCSLDYPQTATTGQVIASQKILESGVNLADKSRLARSWDVHAERQLECTDCHFALNNPAYRQGVASAQPDHLVYDPRRLEIGEYLERPDHNLARGQSAQFTIAPEIKATMRRCEGCHSAQTHADWLPYLERHMDVLACESCHIPKLYAPAIQQVDWTVLQVDGSPRMECRGVEGQSGDALTQVKGYEPVLLMRRNVDGDTLLAPYNLISAWYWVYDDANGHTRPVRLVDLQAAWLEGERYAPQVIPMFDANGNGRLEDGELLIDSEAKKSLIAGRLVALGLKNPRIAAEVQPYSINHNVARGDWVVRDCQVCHNHDSRLAQPIQLARYVPGGVMPEFVKDTNVSSSGELRAGKDGALYYQPATNQVGVYIFGHNRVGWVDTAGLLIFLGVLAGVAGHSGLRFYAALRRPRPRPALKLVYMYDAYERFWHWLQTLVILLLIFTGLVIHRPDLLGMLSFRHMVTVHNVLAVILIINAALSLFYHLTTGQIRQFIPRPYGFFDQAIVQAKFYLGGIFRGEPHPFEKTRNKKLNPLQQATYFGLLNVLLPLQVITGALMWGAQQWPQVAGALGGLPFLAPLHTLLAWLFGTFIILHLYLTTTGARAQSDIKALITGWEEVEAHAHAELAEKA